MPTNQSKPKGKATAQQNANERIATRDRAPQGARSPSSAKRASQSRFPGETPLTGEDRPTESAGRKRG
jgi:hypothetical protein